MNMNISDVKNEVDYIRYMNQIADCVLHINSGRYVFEMNDVVINPFAFCRKIGVDINKFKEVCKDIPTGMNRPIVVVDGKKKYKMIVESYPRFWSNSFIDIVYY